MLLTKRGGGKGGGGRGEDGREGGAGENLSNPTVTKGKKAEDQMDSQLQRKTETNIEREKRNIPESLLGGLQKGASRISESGEAVNRPFFNKVS